MNKAFDDQIVEIIGAGRLSPLEIAEKLGVPRGQRARVAPNLKRLVELGRLRKVNMTGTVSAKGRRGGRYVVYMVER